MLLLLNNLRRTFIAPLVGALARVYDAKSREPIWRSSAKRLLERSFKGIDGGVIVFDWITKDSPLSVEWVETIVATARTMRIGAISLPHGDSPHANRMIREGEWTLKPDTLFSAGKIFDKLVVPNELCAKRFRPFLHHSAIAVLGSPRYCDEWLARLSSLSPGRITDQARYSPQNRDLPEEKQLYNVLGGGQRGDWHDLYFS
jgi:hypothetical protein